MKINPATISVLIIYSISLILQIPLAGALYSYDGIPLSLDAQSTFKGEIYIDGGHGLSFTPYTQSFDVPKSTVRWASLYVGVWGGTENYEGWVQPEFNGQRLERLQLAGINDKNENVYCAGHGVYWVSYEVSNLTINGKNTVEVRTSSGEPGNKLDGRVYGAVLAAACEDKKAPMISYQVLVGNANLHGKGWSGSLPDVNDLEEIQFNLGKTTGAESAQLSVVYLTGTKGLPNFLEFNGKMLGIQPQYLSGKYGNKKVTDIANEVCYDASGGEGKPSSYLDIERFDVLEYLQAENSAVFIRGLDLNEDGEIDEQEGEDYLHPVMAALIITSKETAPVLPDLYPEIEIDEEELVEGKDAKIPFVINNPGGICEENCTISLQVDGNEVSALPLMLEPSGLSRSAFSWPAVRGEHLLELSADPGGEIKESNKENNACSLTVEVKTKPDLLASLGDPVKIETEKEPAASLIVLPLLTLFGFRRKRPQRHLFLLLLLVIALASFSGCLEQKSEPELSAYMIPVIIENSGEAPARNFDAELYLDGECITVLNIPELAGQNSIEEKIRVTVSPGEHVLGVKVDERNHISESNEENNEFETGFNFV